MRVIVCGGRDFSDYDAMVCALNKISELEDEIEVIISGTARGADSLGERYAKENDIQVERYPAQWNRFGKSAGYKRNVQMAEEGLPDIVIAFPGGKGTQHMIDIATERNIGVFIINTDNRSMRRLWNDQ